MVPRFGTRCCWLSSPRYTCIQRKPNSAIASPANTFIVAPWLRTTQGVHSAEIENQCDSDLVSVVQLDSNSHLPVRGAPIRSAPDDLFYRGGGTCFYPAAYNARTVAHSEFSIHVPLVVFHERRTGDRHHTSQEVRQFQALNNEVKSRTGSDLELDVIAFGWHACQQQPGQIAQASPIGKVGLSSDTADLSNVLLGFWSPKVWRRDRNSRDRL